MNVLNFLLPSRKESRKNNLKKIFDDSQKEQNSSYKRALNSYYDLNDAAANEGKLLEFLLEDVIFKALNITYFEYLLVAIKDNQNVMIPLIKEFQDSSHSRDQMIANQTENHLFYILNNGKCSGCPDCSNHKDVQDLVIPWHNKDLSFFKKLYIGTQTILYFLEQLSYDFVPANTKITNNLSFNKILKLRQYIYKSIEDA